MPRQRPSDLKSRMQAYRQSAGARIAAGCRDRFGNWFVYAAAAGSALALSSNASASIVYGTVNQSASITPLNGAIGENSAFAPTFNIDGVPFGLAVFSARSQFGPGTHGNGADALNQTLHDGLEINNSGALKRLASGDQVSAGKMSFLKASSLHGLALFGTSNGAASGTWPKSQQGFAGIGIQKNGHTYLGWLRLEYFESNGAIDKVEAFDYAYNTVPGGSIAAGDTGVPEPSTAALTLLAAGAAGIAALRRRRAAKA